VLLCVLASLLVPGIASAHSAAGAENRVWAFDLSEQVHVAGAATLTPELHQGCGLAEYDSASGSLLAARGGLRIADGQFGKKLGKHAADFGLDPSNPQHREAFRGIIEGIASSPDRVVSGIFRGQGAVDFLIKGSDVVVSKGGEFVTVLKGGVNNPSVLKALGQ
jgi:hypothetical protein